MCTCCFAPFSLFLIVREKEFNSELLTSWLAPQVERKTKDQKNQKEGRLLAADTKRGWRHVASLAIPLSPMQISLLYSSSFSLSRKTPFLSPLSRLAKDLGSGMDVGGQRDVSRVIREWMKRDSAVVVPSLNCPQSTSG